MKVVYYFFQALKVLHNSTEFLPHVIFLCPPPVETNYNIITTAPDLENGKPCQNIELAVSRRQIAQNKKGVISYSSTYAMRVECLVTQVNSCFKCDS